MYVFAAVAFALVWTVIGLVVVSEFLAVPRIEKLARERPERYRHGL